MKTTIPNQSHDATSQKDISTIHNCPYWTLMKWPKYPSQSCSLSNISQCKSHSVFTHRAQRLSLSLSLSHGVHGFPSPSKAPTPTQSQTFLLLPIMLILRLCFFFFFFFTEHRENSRGEQRRNRLPNHEDREEARDSDRRGVQRRRPWRASCQIGRRGRPYRSSTGSVELPQRVVDCRRCVSHRCAGELEKGIRFSVWLVRKCGKIREIEFVLFWADYAYVVDCWS